MSFSTEVKRLICHENDRRASFRFEDTVTEPCKRQSFGVYMVPVQFNRDISEVRACCV